ncbi:GNAT family N-acetyltransferase [Streptomyces sp. NPDC046831]|uniref:GNAT family N-acetyltransferase n=1 Tax=Streptomyces sp. NPDC046831 TaxID=3154805 RepID=UPI003405B69A
MTVTVRALRPEARADLEGFARVRRRALPFILLTPDSLAYDLRHMHPDAHYRPLVAVADGEVIGTAQVHLTHDSGEPGQGNVNVYVDPAHTRRGAGGLLLRAAEEHLAALGARRLYAWVLDEPGNRAFAESNGYRASRSAHFLRLDLAAGTLPPAPVAPPGVEVRSAADFAGDPRPLFELDAETVTDEPSDVDMRLSDYDAWLTETWRHPLVSAELSSVAVVDGRPAAFTLTRTDGSPLPLRRPRAGGASVVGTVMTGTARAFRGRGLARLVKTDALHRARAAGFTQAFTGNDTGNGPMLAVNRRLGYEICATEVRHVRELG